MGEKFDEYVQEHAGDSYAFGESRTYTLQQALALKAVVGCVAEIGEGEAELQTIDFLERRRVTD